MAESVIIKGTTYNTDVVGIPKSDQSGDAVFYNTEADDVAAGNVLTGKQFHGAGGAGVGNMPENGTVTRTISSKADVVQIAEGHHSGSGSVQIATAEQAKIVSGNIRSGVTILGQQGKSTVVDTEVSSSAAGNIETGYKAYVNGALVEGTNDPVHVAQDAVTGVLRIW